MTAYEIYVFFLCFIIFTMFVVVFGTLIALVLRLKLKLIRLGAEDESIRREYEEMQAHPPKSDLIIRIISYVLCGAFVLFFSFSCMLNLTDDCPSDRTISLKVVRSGSMAVKNDSNKYLVNKQLDNQIQLFDLIVTAPLPAENELRLYDIVVYRNVKDELIVHRIVAIEEPNEDHPDEYRFVLRGDANIHSDAPIGYDQMCSIYTGTHMPFIGSLVVFLQEPVGWLCLLLILCGMFVIPFVEKKLETAKNERLEAMGLLPKPSVPEPEPELSIEGLVMPDQVADVMVAKPRFSQKEDIRIFQQRLWQQSAELKLRYARINSFLCEHSRVSVSFSPNYQTFRISNRYQVKLAVKTGSILVYLPLQPAVCRALGCHTVSDVSDTRSFSALPSLVRIRTDEELERLYPLLDKLTRF
ncbi:MAG: hypothetical protein IJW99_08515 [Clostridia bacterium]|nr:hypothetical protein [Clostridia bacterium]